MFCSKEKAKIKLLEEKINAYKEKVDFLEKENNNIKEENSKLKLSLKEKNNYINTLEEKLNKQTSNSTINKKDSFNDFSKVMDFSATATRDSLLDIQKNIIEVVDNSREALDNMQSNVSVTKDTSNELERVILDVSDINTKFNKIKNSSEVLYERSQKITESIQVINSIVLQINILSLNASVEAASAGEAGKGFAVVAGEVKNLANRTSDASKEIGDVVKEIQESVDFTRDSIIEGSEIVDKALYKIKEYKEHINNYFGSINSNFSFLDKLININFMNLAKIDHVIWKVNTYLSVIKKDEVFKFVSHNNCRLGKWYNEGLGKQFFNEVKSYNQLLNPHSNVHNSTREIFDIIKRKDINYNKILEISENMEDNSKKLFEILDRFLIEKY